MSLQLRSEVGLTTLTKEGSHSTAQNSPELTLLSYNITLYFQEEVVSLSGGMGGGQGLGGWGAGECGVELALPSTKPPNKSSFLKENIYHLLRSVLSVINMVP